MCNKLYWHGDEEFGWSARGSRGIGGDYWIVRTPWQGAPASKVRFQISFQERHSGNKYWLRKIGDTLDEAKIIAQADNDARRVQFQEPAL
jgi:hypothetical protein